MSSTGHTSGLIRQAAAFSLAATLVVPQVGYTAGNPPPTPARKLIFPGDPLPKEIGFPPLRVGAAADSDVQVGARDWFLLKDPNLALSSPAAHGKALALRGPVLDASNTQLYFRLVSGMILKESMQQMGMNSAQARLIVERAAQAGIDLDKASLKDLGILPKGLAELAENWERPLARASVLPYLLLPLSVAHDQSHFQHFSQGAINDSETSRMCSAISTAAPLGPVQTRISDRQKQLDQLSNELRNAQSRLLQSNNEQARLAGVVKDLSVEIEKQMKCVGVIKDRVARGSSLPDAQCLAVAQTTMQEAELTTEWQKFTSTNLQNEKGDFSVKQQLEIELKALEARLAETQALVRSLQDIQEKSTRELTESREKIAKLSQDLTNQKSAEAVLDQEQVKLQAELQAIQTLNHRLETGVLRTELSDEQLRATISETPARAKRMDEIKLRLSQILQSKVKLQANQSAITTQVEFLTGSIDGKKAQVESAQAQLNGSPIGLLEKLKTQQAQVQIATSKFLKASDQAAFSEYVVSILSRRLTSLAQSRDANFNQLKKEEALAETYKKQIETAQKAKDTQLAPIQTELQSLESLIASYRDVQQMGWFLENECSAREVFSADKPGVYLSRAKIAETNSRTLPTTPVDGGRWGLFNMDYAHFQAPIQSGVLLNMPGNIQLAVQQIIANYDHAMTQYLDPAAAKCTEADTSRQGAIGVITQVMRAAFAIWTEGNDDQAKARGLACRPAPQRPGQANARANFATSLNKLIAFEGTVLDAALPQTGQTHSLNLIERQAISLIGRELAILNGSARTSGIPDLQTRRDQVIKSLIRVLAYDYEAALASHELENSKQKEFEYIFASQAPGATAQSTAGLAVGQTYRLKTLARVRLYSLPIAKARYESNTELSLNDRVQILPADDSNESNAVRAGWIKVQARNQALWMPAWPVATSVLLDEQGQALSNVSQLSNCPNPRLVTRLTNFQGNSTSVQRFTANMRTREMWTEPTEGSRWRARRTGIWYVDTSSPSTSPASTNKNYVACDTFTVEGQAAKPNSNLRDSGGVDFSKALAIRIVEVRPLRAANGETVYVPMESTGGYVSTWIPRKNTSQPRIQLGSEIDTATWGLKK